MSDFQKSSIFERNQRLDAITQRREAMVMRLSRSTDEINNFRAIVLPGHPPIQFLYLLEAVEAWYMAERQEIMAKFRQQDNVAKQIQDNERLKATSTILTIDQIVKE